MDGLDITTWKLGDLKLQQVALEAPYHDGFEIFLGDRNAAGETLRVEDFQQG